MYYGMFESKKDVADEFHIDDSVLAGCTILFAAYDCDNDGQALVVYRHQRKLYEVNGSHCSCYGLEGQWEPELTSVKALRHRIEHGTLGYLLGGFTAAFNEMLDKLTRKSRPPASS